jgi:NhaA family Na+:H+ antiporter
MLQADTLLDAEASHSGEQLRHGPSEAALRELDGIFDRLESPADRMLRNSGPRSSYLVLPLFALANAGVVVGGGVFDGRESLLVAIVAALVIGKPLGFIGACALAVRLGLAVKRDEYSWRQLAGAGALAGIGFTMSLFIASLAFGDGSALLDAAKVGILAASLIAATAGWLMLRGESSTEAAPRRS